MQKVDEINLTVYIPTANYKYYHGCRRMGRDNDGLLKVSNIIWTDDLDLNYASTDYAVAENLLNSIKKYAAEPNVKYSIATINIYKKIKVDMEY